MRLFTKTLIVLALIGSSGANAQLVWKQITTPEPVQHFAHSPDGSLYFSNGDFTTSRLYRSTNGGVTWDTIYKGLITTLQCDSAGYVFVADSLLRFTANQGQSWNALKFKQWFGSSSILACSDAAYYIADPGGLVSRNQKNMTVDTVAKDDMLDDWAALYAGSGDRMIAATSFNGSFRYRVNGKSINDTENFIAQCPIMDNDPINNAVFSADGYAYISHCSYLARLAPGSHRWEVYDSVAFGTPDARVPLAALGSSLIAINKSGTFISSDHADTWTTLGSGIQTDYPLGMQVAFTAKGVGYAVNADTLYTTDYFAAVPLQEESASMLIGTPSPVHSVFHVSVERAQKVEVVSITGAVVEVPFSITESGLDFNVEQLLPGVYFALIRTSTGVHACRFIKM